MSKAKESLRSLLCLLLVMLAVLAGCEKGPSTPEEYIALGRQYLEELNYEEALIAFTNAIELDANNIDAYLGRSKVYLATESYAEALADFDAIISLDPDIAEAYAGRAEANTALGNLEDALADYDKLLSLEPDNAEAYADRAEVNEALGNLEDALADYEKAVELDPAREAELAPHIDALREALRPKTYAELNGLVFSPAADFTTVSSTYPPDRSASLPFDAPVTFDEVSLTDNGDGTLTATVTTTMRGQIRDDIGYTVLWCIDLSPWDEYTGHTIPTTDEVHDLYGDAGFADGGGAYAIEWQGESYTITASQEGTLTWPSSNTAIYTCSVHVTYPQEYDGLCFNYMNMPEHSAEIRAALDALEDGHYLMDDPTWNDDWHLFRFSDLLAAFG